LGPGSGIGVSSLKVAAGRDETRDMSCSVRKAWPVVLVAVTVLVGATGVAAGNAALRGPHDTRASGRAAHGAEPAPPVSNPPVPLTNEAGREYRVMSETRYQHLRVVSGGRFFYDCVGFLAYALGQADPVALATINRTFSIAAHRVPSPARFVSLFDRLDGAQLGWRPIRRVADLEPGDVIAWTYVNPTGSNGHAAVVAEAPVASSAGSYLVTVWDSTATPHGPADTRRVNPRNLPGPNGRPSGLGSGTIRVDARPDTGAVLAVHWSPSSGPLAPAHYGLGRPTR
jgi:hypothetical protein